MTITNSDLASFFQAQVAKQQRWFQAAHADKFICYVGSSASPGELLDVTAHRLLGLERGGGSTEIVVRLGGSFAPPDVHRIATVTIFEPHGFRGYQLKTRPAPSGAPAIATDDGPVTVVRAGQAFTLHHSPFMLTAFEKIPVEEVLATVGGARHALVGVGTSANLSPRFCWHHEEIDGKLVLFHGDGLPMKTYLNLKSNPSVTRVALDPETFEGYAGYGRVEEFRPAEHPEAYDRICQGFANGGWGKPARVFRFVADRWAAIAPQG